MVDSNDLLTALGRVVREREESAGDAALVTAAAHQPQVASYDHLVDAVMLQIAQGDSVGLDSATSDSAASASVPLPPPTSLASQREARSNQRRLWIGLPALAAAAGLSLLVGRGLLREDAGSASALAPYAAELKGAVSAVRSVQNTNTGALTLVPGAELTVLLRPEHPVTGEVGALVALSAGEGAGSARNIETRNTVAASGSLRVSFAVPTDLSQSGRICTVVGRPEHLQSALTAATDKGEGWQRFCWQFVHIDARTGP